MASPASSRSSSPPSPSSLAASVAPPPDAAVSSNEQERLQGLILQQHVFERVERGGFRTATARRRRRGPPQPRISFLLVDVAYLYQNCGYEGCVDVAKLRHLLEVFNAGLPFNRREFIPTEEPQYTDLETALLAQGFRCSQHTASRNCEGELKGVEGIAMGILDDALDRHRDHRAHYHLTVLGHRRVLLSCFEQGPKYHLLCPYFCEGDRKDLRPLQCKQRHLALYDVWDHAKVRAKFTGTLQQEHAHLRAAAEATREWMARHTSPPVPSAELQALPIYQYRDAILASVAQHRVTVISGHTGCGKSTQVPQYLLEADSSAKVIVTQPRRLAAVSLWQRVRTELGPQRSHLVGFAIGGKQHRMAEARLLFCTTGLLLTLLRSDPELSGYTHVICDEVHERTLDGDLLLSWLRRILQRRPSRLKVVVMSATLSVDRFSRYFGQQVGDQHVGVVQVEQQRRHAVDIHYLETILLILQQDYRWKDPPLGVCLVSGILKLCCDLVKHLHEGSSTEHAILVFLPGIVSILDVFDRLEAQRDMDLHILHSEMRPEEQARVLEPSPAGVRKVILSTNIAESSLTLPDVDVVLDFCVSKEMHWDEDRRLQHLREEWTSKDSATQRAGRTGRVRPGAVYRLLPEAYYQRHCPEARSPEMQRASVASQLLRAMQVAAFGQQWGSVFQEAPDPPAEHVLKAARHTLLDMRCVASDLDAEDPEAPHMWKDQAEGDVVTGRGQVLCSLPLDLRAGMLVLYGAAFDCLLLSTSAAAIAQAAQYPIAGLNFFDTVNEAKARWGYAGRWESDIIAGIAAHIEFRRLREAHRDRPKQELKGCCKARGLNLSGLVDLDQVFHRVLQRLRRAGLEGAAVAPGGPGGAPDPTAGAALTRRMEEQFADPDKRLLLTMLVAGAFVRNTLTLRVPDSGGKPFYLERDYRQAEFLGISPGEEEFCRYLTAQVGEVESCVGCAAESSDVRVLFAPTAHPDDSPPLYLVSKLRGSSDLNRTGFERLTIDVAGDMVAEVQLNGFFVRVEQSSVVHPVIMMPNPQEYDEGLGATACEMFLVGGRARVDVVARRLQALPRSLPHLWRLLLWLFASQAQAPTPAQGPRRRVSLFVEGDLRKELGVEELFAAIPDVQPKVAFLRQYLHSYLAEDEVDDVLGEEEDGLLGEAVGREEPTRLHRGDPEADGGGSVCNGSPSPALAATCLLSLAKGLFRMAAVPNYGHFASWQDTAALLLLDRPSIYNSGWSLKPPTSYADDGEVWDDIWVAPPTQQQAAVFDRVLTLCKEPDLLALPVALEEDLPEDEPGSILWSPLPTSGSVAAVVATEPALDALSLAATPISPVDSTPAHPSPADPPQLRQSPDEHYWQLLDMGFAAEAVVGVLDCYNGTLDHAITILTSDDAFPDAPSPPDLPHATSSVATLDELLLFAAPPPAPQPSHHAPAPHELDLFFSTAVVPPGTPPKTSIVAAQQPTTPPISPVGPDQTPPNDPHDDDDLLQQLLEYLSHSPGSASPPAASGSASSGRLETPQDLKEALELLASAGWQEVVRRYNLEMEDELEFAEPRHAIAQFRQWVAGDRRGPCPVSWDTNPHAGAVDAAGPPAAVLPDFTVAIAALAPNEAMPPALPADLAWLADAAEVQRRLAAGWDPTARLPTPPGVAAQSAGQSPPPPPQCTPLWLAWRLRLTATVAVLLADPQTSRDDASPPPPPQPLLPGDDDDDEEAEEETPETVSCWVEDLDGIEGPREVEVLQTAPDGSHLVRFKDTGEEGVVADEDLHRSEAEDPDPMAPSEPTDSAANPKNRIGQLRDKLLVEDPNSVVDQQEMGEYIRTLWPRRVKFRLYGELPWTLHSRGVQLLNRTFMECKPDHVARPLAQAIIRELRLRAQLDPEWLARVGVALASDARARPVPKAVVLDLFAGSANVSYWFHKLLGCPTFGFEAHPEVHRRTARNLRLVGSPDMARNLLSLDFREGLRRLAAAGAVPADALVVCLIDPPWGEAMSLERGLDLRRTSPPVLDIIGGIVECLPLEVAQGRVAFLIHTFTGRRQKYNGSVAEVVAACTHAVKRRVSARQGYLFGFS